MTWEPSSGLSQRHTAFGEEGGITERYTQMLGVSFLTELLGLSQPRERDLWGETGCFKEWLHGCFLGLE